MKKLKRLSLILVAAMMLLTVACGKPKQKEITEISIQNRPSADSVTVGSKFSLSVKTTPADLSATYEWLSSDESVATVNGGNVDTLKIGSTVISVKITEKNIADSFTLTVKAPDKEIPGISDLLDDELLNGQYNPDGSNSDRIPTDEEYQKLLEKKRPLGLDETYVETFDNDYFDTKLAPTKIDKGASYELTDSVNFTNSSGKVLVLSSDGDYDAVYLTGMKFTAKAIYKISFDYKVIDASNDFIFQLRSLTGGSQTDIYTEIKSGAGETGRVEMVRELGNYTDYEIMLMPRNEAGKIAVDNISFTRLGEINKPTDKFTEDFDYDIPSMNYEANNGGANLSLTSDVAEMPTGGVGKALKVTGKTDGKFGGVLFITPNLDKNQRYVLSFDIKILSNTPDSPIYVKMGAQGTETRISQYQGFDGHIELALKPSENRIMIFGESNVNGLSFTLDNVNIGEYDGVAGFEDFEGKPSFTWGANNGAAALEITENAGNKAMRVDVKSAYGGIILIPNIDLTQNKNYNVKMDIKQVSGESALYVQLGNGSTGNFKQVDLTGGFVGSFNEAIVAPNGVKFLQLFTSGANVVFEIDNVVIEELLPQESAASEHFENSLFNYKWVTNNGATVDFIEITTDKAEIPNDSDRALKITANSSYGGIIFTLPVGLEKGVDYTVKFDIKIVANPNSSTLYVNLWGADKEIDTTVGRVATEILILNSNTFNELRMFGGGNTGGFIFVLDNISYEKVTA